MKRNLRELSVTLRSLSRETELNTIHPEFYAEFTKGEHRLRFKINYTRTRMSAFRYLPFLLAAVSSDGSTDFFFLFGRVLP